MSYAFDMLFVKPTMAKEGDALKYGMYLVRTLEKGGDVNG